MALGTTARKPEGLQVSFLEQRYDADPITVNGTRTFFGTVPKGALLLALYTPRAQAPAGGTRQIWFGTLSDKTALVNTAGFTEGTAVATATLKTFAFTQDTDIYITQTGMQAGTPVTAGIWDFTFAYVVSPQFGEVIA